MAFDPDEYLSGGTATETFNPDEYLKPSFDPDEYLGIKQSLTPETDKALVQTKGLVDRTFDALKAPSPEWLQPIEKAITSPLPGAKEAVHFGYQYGSPLGWIEDIAPDSSAGKWARDVRTQLEHVGEGFTSPANLGLIATGGATGKAIQGLIGLGFTAQQAKTTLDTYRQWSAATDPEEKHQLGIKLGVDAGLTALMGGGTAAGHFAKGRATRPVESSEAKTAKTTQQVVETPTAATTEATGVVVEEGLSRETPTTQGLQPEETKGIPMEIKGEDAEVSIPSSQQPQSEAVSSKLSETPTRAEALFGELDKALSRGDQVAVHVIKRTIEKLPREEIDAYYDKFLQEEPGTKPVSSETQPATVTPSGPEAQTLPELPKNKPVNIKALTPEGEPLEIKMDAQKAERMITRRKNNLQSLLDCLSS